MMLESRHGPHSLEGQSYWRHCDHEERITNSYGLNRLAVFLSNIFQNSESELQTKLKSCYIHCSNRVVWRLSTSKIHFRILYLKYWKVSNLSDMSEITQIAVPCN